MKRENYVREKRKVKSRGHKGCNTYDDSDDLVEIVNNKKIRRDWKLECRKLLETEF